ncbi:PEP-CTERM sorting domain-containing protein [Desulfogranum marinum]|uniref:PEP-CTERM sorting domain-containing protein n=1 Tax=Desulfogranum marinum TaxID=453220 RepID=UPI0029C8E76A|nr:PEP-CTERM sorting domain-containing protein [Desulfogranum marinum]
MKKRMLKSTIIGFFICSITAGSALALPGYTGFDEFELLNPDTVANIDPFNIAQLPFDATDTDADGFYIWTNSTRSEMTILWTGDQVNGDTRFKGEVSLLGLTSTPASKIRFESGTGTNQDDLSQFGNAIDFRAWAGSSGSRWYDGFSIAVTQNMTPSYIAFDLQTSKDHPISFSHEETKIFFGESGKAIGLYDSDTDGTFAITAPIPEPTTMLLFGTGLASLAGIARRRRK